MRACAYVLLCALPLLRARLCARGCTARAQPGSGPERARAFATVYALSITIFGGTTQPVIAWLTHVTGKPMAPAAYMFTASFIALIAMLLILESAPSRAVANLAAQPKPEPA